MHNVPGKHYATAERAIQSMAQLDSSQVVQFLATLLEQHERAGAAAALSEEAAALREDAQGCVSVTRRKGLEHALTRVRERIKKLSHV